MPRARHLCEIRASHKPSQLEQPRG
jgi:hypothetical protein